jgi:hypothetical protein
MLVGMYGPEVVNQAFALRRSGHTQDEIAAELGIGQTTVGRWLRSGENAVVQSPMRRRSDPGCPLRCLRRSQVPPANYAYLLGQYLGDGTIVSTGQGVYRLFITCCATYPAVIADCENAVSRVMPSNSVGRRTRRGAVDVWCYSKHWPCLFPQCGPGKKHTRRIELEPWQSAIALDSHAQEFLRGLIHSDGCRSINRVTARTGRQYEYVRYQFSNRSGDIRALFTQAYDRLAIEWRQMNGHTISVARRTSVKHLDAFVGPKS